MLALNWQPSIYACCLSDRNSPWSCVLPSKWRVRDGHTRMRTIRATPILALILMLQAGIFYDTGVPPLVTNYPCAEIFDIRNILVVDLFMNWKPHQSLLSLPKFCRAVILSDVTLYPSSNWIVLYHCSKSLLGWRRP